MKIVIYVLIFLTANFAHAQFAFPNLKYLDVKSSHMGGTFGYSNDLDFQLINKNCSEVNACDKYDEPTTYIGTLTLENSISIDFHYTEAPSDDPVFIASHNGKIILEEAGTTLHLKGKTIYIEGIANSHFNKKRKFQFTNNEFIEVKQAFYAIDFKGKLNFQIDIYQTENFINKVASLPVGYEVEIILGKTGGEYDDLEYILIKSKFGLMGWFNFKKTSFGKPLIDGFHFHGD